MPFTVTLAFSVADLRAPFYSSNQEAGWISSGRSAFFLLLFFSLLLFVLALAFMIFSENYFILGSNLFLVIQKVAPHISLMTSLGRLCVTQHQSHAVIKHCLTNMVRLSITFVPFCLSSKNWL